MTEDDTTMAVKKPYQEIPIFFAVDDRYVPYLATAMCSMMDNASKEYKYRIYILIDSLNAQNRANLLSMQNECFTVDFVNVGDQLNRLGTKLHMRDYYTKATYYRFFIPELFPQYKKGVYLDCDIAVMGDISEFYNTELGDNLLGGVTDEVITEIPVFAEYAEKVLGVPRKEYFNAGILLMNLEEMRKVQIDKALVRLMQQYQFCVAQDQDYLNVLCHRKIVYLPTSWNKTAFPGSDKGPKVNIIHFKINWKPWHYKGIAFEQEFWKYAAQTQYEDVMLAEREGYTKEQTEIDSQQYAGLMALAAAETEKAELPGYRFPIRLSVKNTQEEASNVPEKSQDRLAILAKIAELEKQGLFDQDVENDPPSRPILPGEVDYLGEKFMTRLATRIANKVAKHHFDGCIERGELVIKGVRGIENYLAVAESGAVITCNHFNPFDNYAVYKVIEPYLGRKQLYKVIREGNYTAFGGLYGFFFRHCNTLPLCTSISVWREMLEAVSTLLKRGEKILIYPEQGMWWNYRKPRPLKAGAFQFAAKAGVPVLPMFITMEDTDRIGPDGFPIQAYTVHILPALYPDSKKSARENAKRMCAENYYMWKRTYEDTYGEALSYTTEGKEVQPCSM